MYLIGTSSLFPIVSSIDYTLFPQIARAVDSTADKRNRLIRMDSFKARLSRMPHDSLGNQLASLMTTDKGGRHWS